jgi:hypothetical protein
LLSVRRDLAAARRFSSRALRAGTVPDDVTTDRAPVYPRVLNELIPYPDREGSRMARTQTPKQGAAIAIRLATLRDDGSTGGLFDDTGIVPGEGLPTLLKRPVSPWYRWERFAGRAEEDFFP